MLGLKSYTSYYKPLVLTPTVGTLFWRCETKKFGEIVKNGVASNLMLAAILVAVMSICK